MADPRIFSSQEKTGGQQDQENKSRILEALWEKLKKLQIDAIDKEIKPLIDFIIDCHPQKKIATQEVKNIFLAAINDEMDLNEFKKYFEWLAPNDSKLKLPSKTLNQTLEEARIPGVSIATVSNKGVIATQIAGVTNISAPQAVTVATIFEAASLSKPVFSYIILKMIKRGELSRAGESPESGLDRPLHEMAEFGPPHLRNNPYYKLLTPRLILSHQAGLPNWFQPGKPEDYLAMPGKRFDYSGVAFCFLKDVIENKSGKSFENFAKEIFTHLEMHNSSFLAPEDGALKNKNYAIGHHANGNIDEVEHFPRKLGVNPAASLFTTAEDHSKFLYACMRDPFVKQHMFQVQVELNGKDHKAIDAKVSSATLEQMKWGMGIGLQIAKDGKKIAFHWGDNNTCRAFFAINLDTSEAAVCFTNSANGPRIFPRVSELASVDLSAAFHWLSYREKLIIFPEPKTVLDVSHRNTTAFFMEQKIIHPNTNFNSNVTDVEKLYPLAKQNNMSAIRKVDDDNHMDEKIKFRK